MEKKWNPDLYNEKHSFVYQYGAHLIDLLKPQKNERILDLGCGSGQLTSEISRLAGEVTGIDKSSTMISDAKSRFGHLEFEVGDAACFHFDKKFDAIFSNATLHWVTDYRKCAACMFDNLKPGGRIVVEFGGKGNVETIVNQLRMSLSERGYTQQSSMQLWYFPSVGEYATLLESVGFHVKLAQHYDRPTELADENTGIADWLTMFAEHFFTDVDPTETEEIKMEIQEKVKSKCLVNGKWFADYKRIRVIAVRE